MPPYILKNNSRSRRITIRIKSDGIVSVTKPKSISIKQVEDFILSKKDWINDNIKSIDKISVPKLTRKDYLHYRKIAYDTVLKKIDLYNQHYGFKYNNISIRDQKTRWGSCSRKRNLNFNYKLALISPRLVDYVVVHELCHLGQFNHSLKFWNLVGETIPDYMDRRRELKKIHL